MQSISTPKNESENLKKELQRLEEERRCFDDIDKISLIEFDQLDKADQDKLKAYEELSEKIKLAKEVLKRSEKKIQKKEKKEPGNKSIARYIYNIMPEFDTVRKREKDKSMGRIGQSSIKSDDFRYIHKAYKDEKKDQEGLENEEIIPTKPYPYLSRETELLIASSYKFRGKVQHTIEKYGTVEPQEYKNDPESLLISQEEEREKDLIEMGVPDLLLTLKQAKTVSEAKQARNRLRWAIDYEFGRQKKEIDTVNQIFEERIAEIKKEHQKVGLLKFNEKIIREVKQEMGKLSKADNKTLCLWKSRLENLKLPGNSSESQWVTEWRTRQLENINNLLRKLDAKLTPQRKGQEERKKVYSESEKLAKEMVQYIQEKKEAAKLEIKSKRGRKGKVDWKTLNLADADTYEASFGMIALFKHLRKTNPDLMLRLCDEIAHLNQSLKEDYRKILELFTKTHNSFNFSPEAMAEIGSKYPVLVRKLRKNLRERHKEEDQEFDFHLENTRLPAKVLKRLYRPTN